MKPKSALRSFLTLAGSSLLAISSASAATLYWDDDDTTANADGGAGTWNTALTNWDDALTSGNSVAWVNANNDTAVFGGTAGTVALGTGITVGGLQFDTAGYIINTNTITFGAAGNIVTNADVTIGSALAGSVAVNKTGTGTLTLTTGFTGYTGVLTLSQGTLRLSNTNTGALGTFSGGATLTFAGGTLELINDTARDYNRNTTVTANATISTQRSTSGAGNTHALGTLSIGAQTLTVNSAVATSGNQGLSFDAVTLSGNATFDVNNGSTTTLLTLGAIGDGSGGYGFTKTGTGALQVNNANTFTGVVTLNAGTLRGNNVASFGTGAATLTLAGGTLELVNNTTRNFARNTTVTANATITTQLLDLTGGTLGGGLNHSLGTLAIGAQTLTVNSAVANSGTQSLTFGATTLSGNATFEVNNSAVTTQLNLGAIGGGYGITKSGTGTLSLASGNGYTGSTSITGGTLALTGTGSIASSSTITINSSTSLNVTGLTGNFTVGASQSLGGSGSLIATGKTVIASGTLSPGNSPGTLTQDGGTLQLAVGGDLNWQVYDASGLAGTGYDTVSLINGATLDLSALSAGNTYNINLWSLSAIGSDVNGDAINFNNSLNYAWTLFSTDTAISGFDTSKFTINTGAFNGTSGFSNTLNGSFSLSLGDSNTDLVLNYTAAIPEPGSAFIGSLGLLALLRRRRK